MFGLLLSDLDESVEQSRAAGRPQSLACPGAVTGALERRGEVDLYTCRWRKGDLWAIHVAARQIGSKIDPMIAIRDESGQELVHAGDPPGGRDCALEFTVPADGAYILAVSDVAGRGGSPAASYRLAIETARPDFRLEAKTQRLAIPLGHKAELAIAAIRSGGFKGAIGLSVSGLPTGVTTEGDLLIPPDKAEATIHLVSAADAAAAAAAIEVRGIASWRNASLVHAVTAPAAGNLAPRPPAIVKLIDSSLPRRCSPLAEWNRSIKTVDGWCIAERRFPRRSRSSDSAASTAPSCWKWPPSSSAIGRASPANRSSCRPALIEPSSGALCQSGSKRRARRGWP